MSNLVKNICKNCQRTYEKYDAIGESTNTDFCTEECYFEYYKNKEDIEQRRNKAMGEIMKMSINQKTFTLSIHCVSCNLTWITKLEQIKKLTISNMKCPICNGQIEGILESR